jgi:hypothetical protein
MRIVTQGPDVAVPDSLPLRLRPLRHLGELEAESVN